MFKTLTIAVLAATLATTDASKLKSKMTTRHHISKKQVSLASVVSKAKAIVKSKNKNGECIDNTDEETHLMIDDVFQFVDTNGDNQINPDELCSMMNLDMPEEHKMAKDECDEVFSYLDFDANGQFSKDELCQVLEMYWWLCLPSGSSNINLYL